ncbi:Gp101 [Mycobacteroides abscessus subsp. bolletii]|uniref:3'-5' exoribonuclease domain-containing protein n=1 Tax=Mycobacteroides abscessus TaxID=36809 RepID=UPI0009A7A116|nr:3'-5' exoribonuclease [Mycobacteroides abscessus]SKY55070.1 Gp101 [Mycobacteroides abscessus subsp. bolletii]
MTVYCYDTEFLEDGKTIDLISIGIVCEDGREYYAVNSELPIDPIRKNAWLMTNVIPHLPITGGASLERWLKHSRNSYPQPSVDLVDVDRKDARVKPKWVIANEVREFLVADGFLPELWAYYAAYDHVAFAQLWGRMLDLPTGFPMYTRDLVQEMDRLGVSKDAVPQPENAHDALADARWNIAMLHKLRAAAAEPATVPF